MLTEAEAIAAQERVRRAAVLEESGPPPGAVRTIAGVDVAYDEDSDLLAAAAVLLDATTLTVVERATTTGRAHPRRAGLAVHLGVETGLPCFGVAKTPFAFSYEAPGKARGDHSPLTADDGEEVGRALRTQSAVKPVFVSVGHRIDLDTACAHTLTLTPNYRQPETTRQADHLCRTELKKALATMTR